MNQSQPALPSRLPLAQDHGELAASDVDNASAHLGAILATVFEHAPGSGHAALVVADAGTALARALTAAYRRNLPDARFIDFDSTAAADVLAAFAALAPGDLVVLVQSTNFRLDGFRLRVELFKLGLKVIEHLHLDRMPGIQGSYYIAGLADDPAYYR